MLYKKSKTELGAIRVTKRFAFLPTLVKSNTYIWLETYYTLDKFARTKFGDVFKNRWNIVGWSLDCDYWDSIL